MQCELRLLTAQLVLRPFGVTDVSFATTLLRDAYVMQFLGGAARSDSEALSQCQQMLSTGRSWAIAAKSDSALIGIVSFDGDVPIPFLILQRAYWRRGLATQITARLLQHIDTPTVQDIPDHPILPKLMQRLGYSLTNNLWRTSHAKFERSIESLRQRWHKEYLTHIMGLHNTLGIAADYATYHGLDLVFEPSVLSNIGEDIHQRPQFLMPTAAQAWHSMRAAASEAHIPLQVVSAWRSTTYQASIINAKLTRGQCIEDILRISAAPGYSEHHSGCALDLTCPGSESLHERFAHTAAFAWLSNHAHDFGFNLSYPRDNPHRLAYEPWHWAWCG